MRNSSRSITLSEVKAEFAVVTDSLMEARRDLFVDGCDARFITFWGTNFSGKTESVKYIINRVGVLANVCDVYVILNNGFVVLGSYTSADKRTRYTGDDVCSRYTYPGFLELIHEAWKYPYRAVVAEAMLLSGRCAVIKRLLENNSDYYRDIYIYYLYRRDLSMFSAMSRVLPKHKEIERCFRLHGDFVYSNARVTHVCIDDISLAERLNNLGRDLGL